MNAYSIRGLVGNRWFSASCNTTSIAAAMLWFIRLYGDPVEITIKQTGAFTGQPHVQ